MKYEIYLFQGHLLKKPNWISFGIEKAGSFSKNIKPFCQMIVILDSETN